MISKMHRLVTTFSSKRLTVLFSFIGFICLPDAIGFTIPESNLNRRIDSAFTVGRFVFMASDWEVLYMVDRMQAGFANLTTLGLPEGETVGASWMTVDNKRAYTYGKSNGWIVKFGGKSLVADQFKYGKRRSFLFDHGEPDAAVRRPDGKYFFKGCQMAVRRAWNQWDEPIDLPAGVPCPLDAAWRNPEDYDEVQLMQYDQVWTWHANGTITGPVNFSSFFRMFSHSLEPHPNPPPYETAFLQAPSTTLQEQPPQSTP